MTLKNLFKQSQRQSAFYAIMVCILCLFVGSPGAFGQTHAERRAEAIILWLADAEFEGVQALARLATDGDVEAQLLLGLIDKKSELHGPAIISMSRADRVALLRAPGGISGRNWVHLAAEAGDPRAQAWRDLWSTDADLTTARTFAVLEEPQALAEALLTLVKRRENGFDREVLESDWYPDALMSLSQSRILAPDHGKTLHPGDPQHRYTSTGGPDDDMLQAWLAQSEQALPLRAACASVCGASKMQCTGALYAALGSYEMLLTHGSPVNALIPNDVFLASPRGRAALARRIMLMHATRTRETMLDKLKAVDGCAADWLATQFAAHTPRKIPAP